MQVLTKEEENFTTLEKDEVHVDIEQSTTKFLDIARQVEAFFLQKRFLLSALKPELVVKEEISDLMNELQRKDDLIKRHYEKIGMWQNLLAEMQGYAKSPAQGMPPVQTPGCLTPIPGPSNTPTHGGTSPNPAMVNAMQQQLQQQIQQQQQQQLQQQQQMQQMQQPQQQMPVGMSPVGSGGGGMPSGPGPMMSPQHAMFMQQQNIGQRVSPFPNQGPGTCLPGPLAFLEKTTSNIGITDGRR